NDAIKDAYRNYISTLFTVSGSSKQDAEDYFNTIWEIERTLAAAQKSRVEMRDPQATYNKFSLTELSKETNPLNWSVILPELKVTWADSRLVNNPAFLISVSQLLSQPPADDLRVYLQWNILKNAAPSLSSDFVD